MGHKVSEEQSQGYAVARRMADRLGMAHVHRMRNSESVKGYGTDFHRGFVQYVENNF